MSSKGTPVGVFKHDPSQADATGPMSLSEREPLATIWGKAKILKRQTRISRSDTAESSPAASFRVYTVAGEIHADRA